MTQPRIHRFYFKQGSFAQPLEYQARKQDGTLITPAATGHTLKIKRLNGSGYVLEATTATTPAIVVSGSKLQLYWSSGQPAITKETIYRCEWMLREITTSRDWYSKDIVELIVAPHL